ncbi:MAG: isocitrate dehydrogenase kinase/phosphatase AceK regulatory subunit [Arenicellales bacterium]
MNKPGESESQQVARDALDEFNLFYSFFKQIPNKAKVAFEQRDHAESLRLSNRRLQLYSISIREFSEKVKKQHSVLTSDESRWDQVETAYQSMVVEDYSADLAMAYLHSIRRKIYQGEWRVADYAIYRNKYETDQGVAEQLNRYVIDNTLETAPLVEILNQESFSIDYEDIQRDAGLLAERARRNLDLDRRLGEGAMTLEMFKAGFYRNRGAYLVGRISFDNVKYRPFIIALLNGDNGLYVDALITSSTYAHNMFSSTLANFHVTNAHYHELCRFLRSIMPMRPLGLHYSTIGYNHLGKVAVMNELEGEREALDQVMETAPGTPGTVAMGFCMSDSAYVLKVIRDTPTSGYKWGKFDGVQSVLRKYTKVHEINRTDSMLDSMLFYNLRLDTDWFDTGLMEQLLEYASESVHQDKEALVFKYLIVQRKLTPLPVYLKNATQKQAETAMVNLGYCIKNNAAGNIFNRDLDARNYGVTSYLKVYLFDYDALEELTDVKVRTNTDRIEGEEDVPDWYFEDGVVFLPEELTTGLCLPHRDLRRLFSDQHWMLHTTGYWESIQKDLQEGKVPSVAVYPDTEKLTVEP